MEDDWSLFLKLSPSGCRVAEKNGKVVGTLATIRYQDRFSWLAMVLVNPEERRAGIGTRLLHEGLTLLQNENCIRLDATPAGRHLYRRLGFVDEYSIIRFARSGDVPQPASVTNTVRRMCEKDLPAVLDLDRKIFGADRTAVLRSLFARSPGSAWVAATSNLHGYCFGRPGFLYQHLGPVIAEEESIARDLVSHCLTNGSGRSFGMDAPKSCSSWLAWLQSNGFVEERSLVRMYRGRIRVPGHGECVFGVVGPEFG